jgi:hypothetical protein
MLSLLVPFYYAIVLIPIFLFVRFITKQAYKIQNTQKSLHQSIKDMNEKDFQVCVFIGLLFAISFISKN